MKSPISLAGVALVFFLGFIGSAAASDQERALRPFDVTEIPEAGLSVYVPSRPPWSITTENRPDGVAVMLSTPPDYYPMGVIEITLLKNIRLEQGELLQAAHSALSVGREKAGVSDTIKPTDLKKMQYGQIRVYEDHYTMQAEGQRFAMKSGMGRMPSGKAILLTLVTFEGQLPHLEHMSTKIWSRLKEL